ncbi:MAG: hypothetical protein JKY86_15330 [Gammaproteobacteria bacterium]|nr:hypothetical protein [Gammaproteobacteria bacterium]
MASDTFISGGVTFTMHGDTFANNTGHSIVNSSGGAGLESTAGQVIAGKITRVMVIKMNALTATQQTMSSARSDGTKNPVIAVSSGDDFIFKAGSTLTASAADLDIHIITVQYNQDATTILSISGGSSVTGNAGAEDYDYGTLFADISGGTTANMAILQDITFSPALNTSEVSRIESEMNRRYKGIST